MTPEETMDVLTSWSSLVDGVVHVSLDEMSDLEVLSGLLAERQRFIDALQTLDAPMREAAALRKLGWPGLADDARQRAEDFVSGGLAAIEELARRDAKIIEIMEERRRETLECLRHSELCREYHASAEPTVAHHPLIVDGEI
jgi:hypothetical protein